MKGVSSVRAYEMLATVPGGLDVVSDAQARLGLVGVGEAVVDVFAQTQVEVPVAGFDLVFNVKGQLFYVGVAEVVVFGAAAGEIVGREHGKIARRSGTRRASAGLRDWSSRAAGCRSTLLTQGEL